MRAFALTALFLAALPLHASQTSERVEAFRQYAEQQLRARHVAGASIALVENGAVQTLFALGRVSADSAAPVTVETVFQVGSVSKPVAAWVVMRLVHAGLIDLDAPVSRYVDRWQLPDSAFDHEQVTVRRLLSHTAGLSLGGYPGFREDTQALPTVVESLSGQTNGSGSVYVKQTPGEGFSYSGGGYTLLQLLVEEVSGRPFHAYARDAVLTPLGMNDSSYQPDEQLLARRATPHGFDLDPIPQHHFRAQAAASLHATARDLARFLVANITANRILPPGLLATMHLPVAKFGNRGVGLGFFSMGDGQLVGHGGSNFGWKAEIQFSPDKRNGIVVLTNSESGGQFTTDLVCRWDRDFGAGVTAEECAQRAEGSPMLIWIALTLLAFALALLAWVMFGVIASRRRLGLPRGFGRIAAVAFLVLLAVGGWTLFYTPVGAYLFEGIWTYFATIDYLPEETGIVLAAILVLIVALGATAFTYRREGGVQ